MKKEINGKKKISDKPPVDSGRSMVEMLGTLAVIGVLSIGGISGYMYAMKKYQVNKMVNELNLLSYQIAMIMNQPHESDYELSLGDPYDSDVKLAAADYPFLYGYGDNSTDGDKCYISNNGYYMQLNGIPYSICPILAQTTKHLSYLVEQHVNSQQDEMEAYCTDTETGNTLVLLFAVGEPQIVAPVTTNGVISESTTATPLTTTTTTTMAYFAITMSNEYLPLYTISGTPSECETGNCECKTNDDCDSNYYCNSIAVCSGNREIIKSSECKPIGIT